MYHDSMDKVVQHFFGAVSKEPFVYKGMTYKPYGELNVSVSVFSSLTCPPHCGGCCMNSWSLDYVPAENPPAALYNEKRIVNFNDGIEILSNMQTGRDPLQKCSNLMDNGYCQIHQLNPSNTGLGMLNPISCDMPLLEFQMPSKDDSDRIPRIMHKVFGRGWNLRRVNGTRGAMCIVGKPTTNAALERGANETLRKFARLRKWTDHFGLHDTWIPDIVSWVEKHRDSLILPEQNLYLSNKKHTLFV